MILTCPACATSYSVKDGAIPPHGRTVRCAACKHSWHQDGDASAASVEPVLAETPAAPPPEPVANEPEQAAAPFLAEPEPEVVPEREMIEEAAPSQAAADLAALDVDTAVLEPPPVEPAADWNDAGYGDEEQAAPRRKGLIVLAMLILTIAVLAAAAWFFAPRAWMASAGLVAASSDSPLKLMVTSQDRQKLASGNDLVSLSGRVINPTDSTQPVPALQADLRDNGGKLVYSWTIAPPAARLAPQASASFNAAELGVPANATSLTLRWAS